MYCGGIFILFRKFLFLWRNWVICVCKKKIYDNLILVFNFFNRNFKFSNIWDLLFRNWFVAFLCEDKLESYIYIEKRRSENKIL